MPVPATDVSVHFHKMSPQSRGILESGVCDTCNIMLRNDMCVKTVLPEIMLRRGVGGEGEDKGEAKRLR